jgi:diaminohydroxyphosphoribosylaminopyrimidine deaminase / 5-amino-6-(5-phosphoribosylamino)uracil reductase
VLFDAAGRVGAGGHLFDGEAETRFATTPAAPAAAVDAWKAAGAEVLICEATVTVGGGSGGALAAPPVGQAAVDLEDLVRALGERGVLELLVEGGPRLQASLWAAGLADRLVWYLAPLAIGGPDAPGLLGRGAASLAEARRLRLASVDRLGDDLRVVAYPRPAGGAESAPPDPPKPSLTGES